jgi:hypothetical protein
MVLPNNFSPADHLQDLVKKVWNKEVRNHFKDLGGDDWNPNLNTSRAQYRVGCTHLENDTISMTHLRCMLFEKILNDSVTKYQYVFGIPKDKLDGEITYIPQISLYFCQKSIDVEPGKHFAEGEITFRWSGETANTVSLAKIELLANKIKSKFAQPNTYKWEKGKNYYYYLDKENGYDFRLLAKNITHAKQVIGDVLSIRGHTPAWDSKLKFTEHDNPTQAFPSNTGREIVLSKSRKRPIRRPEVDVYFRYAILNIPLVATITLVDLTGSRSRAVV